METLPVWAGNIFNRILSAHTTSAAGMLQVINSSTLACCVAQAGELKEVMDKIETMYDIPTPTRFTPWGEEKKINNDGYADPYPQKGIDRVKGEKKECRYHFLYADGKEKVFNFLIEAAAFYGVTDAAVNGWLKRRKNIEREIVRVWREEV